MGNSRNSETSTLTQELSAKASFYVHLSTLGHICACHSRIHSSWWNASCSYSVSEGLVLSSVMGLGALPRPVRAAYFLASSRGHPGLGTCGLTRGERPASLFLIKRGPTGCLFIARAKARLKSNPHEGGWAKGYSMSPSPQPLPGAVSSHRPTPQAREQEPFRLFSCDQEVSCSL